MRTRNPKPETRNPPARRSGIPTRYAGVTFRSRLEARWAAMFDLLGWRWAYEPEDLAGYIPDFVIRFRQPLLVEVKPAYGARELMRYRRKIERSGWRGAALLVGVGALEAGPDYAVVGLDRGKDGRWYPAGMGPCSWGGHYTLVSEAHPDCLACGRDIPDCYGMDTSRFEHRWRAAGEKVRWEPA